MGHSDFLSAKSDSAKRSLYSNTQIRIQYKCETVFKLYSNYIQTVFNMYSNTGGRIISRTAFL